jgi:hypothetical protein
MVRDAECVQCWLHEKGNNMGDRGGKKDKTKNQQQLATKQKNKEQKRLDKATPRHLTVNT